jgi:ABC-type lipoprotein export system ATPase subunit
MGQYDSQDNNIPVGSTAQDVKQFEGAQQVAGAVQAEQVYVDAQQAADVQMTDTVQAAEYATTEGAVQNAGYIQPEAVAQSAEGEQSAATEVSAPGDSETPEYMIDAEGLVKIYKTKETEVLALSGLDLKIQKGEFTALIGNSGSGKSTFLNMIGGLDVPSAGKLYVGGKNLFRMTERERVRYKRDTVGFVWQNNARNLFPYLTAIDNVCIPMRISGLKHKKQKAEHLLELVGMINHRNDRLGTLSGGEQQRIAIAIALANSPGLLLADEPTGSVDEKTGDQIFEIFTKLNESGQTILVVTHDLALSRKVRRVVAIRDGRISSERILKESFADRLKESGVDWRNEETQEEFVVVDKAGRLQLPADMIEKLGGSVGRLVVTYEDGQIRLKNPAQNSEN